MENLNNYYIKTNRAFSFIRKYAWIITVLVAIGGQWEPKLGLIVVFIMAGLTITAFFNGRYWCGNFCPHGSLFDKVIMPVSRNKKIPNFLKSKLMIIGFFIFFMANFTRKIINVSKAWGTYTFLDKLGYLFSNTYLMVLIAGGILALFLNSRTWCQFCPMGSLQKISYRLGKALGIADRTEKKITISDKQQCHLCGKCARVCPFQLTPYLEFSDSNQFDNKNCIKCSTCVNNCPAGILSLEKVSALADTTLVTTNVERKKIKAEIIEINKLSDDLNEYVFSFITPRTLNYKAGQFILVKIQDNPKAYRAYSISSYNEDSRTLSVIIKKIENGYGTNKIFSNFKIGDIVDLEGPMGDELVLDPSAEKVLFIANGIGITPFIPLAKDALNNNNLKKVKLIVGQRYEKELLYDEYFKKLDMENEVFEYIPIVSREKSGSLRKGYVTDELQTMDIEGYKVYMCGSKNMIKDSYKILLSKGVKKEDIFYESEEKVDISN